MATIEELIRQELARVFNRYCDRGICQGWERLEDEARERKRGDLSQLPYRHGTSGKVGDDRRDCALPPPTSPWLGDRAISQRPPPLRVKTINTYDDKSSAVLRQIPLTVNDC